MTAGITDGFSTDDDEKVISILKKWKGGPLSDQLFTILAGMIPSSGVATVILQRSRDLEILLLPRPTNDIVWPGMLNLPGKQFRSADFHRRDNNPLNGPLERIRSDEIKTKFIGNPKFAGVSLHSDKRGPQVVLVYLAKIKSSSESVGKWYPVNRLKDMKDFVQSELKSIDVALDFYNSVS